MGGPALVLTGASGFLGWHVRVLARALGLDDPVPVPRAELGNPAYFEGAERVVHLAGVMGPGNRAIAERLAGALRQCATPPGTVVFASSAQAGNGTPYGEGKAAAEAVLDDFSENIRLPNLFGEHGRPHYNSVVATFCHELATGGDPRVHDDRELELLHATDAAALLLGHAAPSPARCTVGELLDRTRRMKDTYATGEIPQLPDRFDVRLFNTYRSHLPPGPRPLPRHVDDRGDLVEAVRAHTGGQAFVSTTRPGVTRGRHFHLAKVERFLVLRGTAEIRIRRLLHGEVTTFRVTGERPEYVDMPAMWAHEITNVGDSELLTLFWSNELFDAGRPDTYPERVVPCGSA